MLKKILMVALLAITTQCYIAAPADAGNSIRLGDLTGGGTNTDTDNPIVLCSGEDCIAGDELIYNADLDCWDCCTGPGCGDIVPCDPTECEEGDCLNWNDTSSCFECNPCPNNPNPICPGAGAGCAAGEELVWDPTNECWDCCANPPGPCDIVPCDPENCQDGDYLVWDPVGGCFACVPPDGPPERRFLYRDQADTFTPVWWVISGDPDEDFAGLDDNHFWYLTPNDNWLPTIGNGPSIRINGDGTSDQPGEVSLRASAGLVLRGTTDVSIGTGSGTDITALDNNRWNLGDIDNGEATVQGLRLPQNATASFVDPTGTDEGYLAWSTDDDELYCNDGTAWAPCAGGASLWLDGTHGLWPGSTAAPTTTPVHITQTDTAETISPGGFSDTGGDLYTEGDVGVGGGEVFVDDPGSTRWVVYAHDEIEFSGNADFLVRGDGNARTLWLLGGSNASPSSGANIEVEGASAGTGSLNLNSSTAANADIYLKAQGTTTAVTLDVEDGATDNLFVVDQSGFDFTGNAGDNVYLDNGILLAFGATTAANAACLVDDGSDRIFHDTDCDDTKDAGEEYIDQAGGGEANADACYPIRAGSADTLETNFAALGTDVTGSNVPIRYRIFTNSTSDFVNYELIVPASLAASGNVTVTLWTRADGSVDASGTDGVWYFDYSGRDDGETYDGAYTQSAFTAETYTSSDDTTLHEVTQTIAVGSFTAGDWLPIRIWRDHDAAGDTFDGSLHLLSAQVCFPQD